MYSLIRARLRARSKGDRAINSRQGEFVMIAGSCAAGALMVWGAPLLDAVTLALGEPDRVRASCSSASCCAGSSPARECRGHATIRAGVRSCARRPFTIFPTKPLPLPSATSPFMLGRSHPPIQLLGAGVSLAFLAGFGWFFLKVAQGHRHARGADKPASRHGMGIDADTDAGYRHATPEVTLDVDAHGHATAVVGHRPHGDALARLQEEPSKAARKASSPRRRGADGRDEERPRMKARRGGSARAWSRRRW